MKKIWVDWRKWGGAPHYQYELDLIGEDGYGRWLASRKGRPVYKGNEFYAEQRGIGVLLIPTDCWWTARFRPDGHIYSDIATPAVWDNASVRLTDLDLDVVRDAGRISVQDVDEFESNRILLGYPQDVTQKAKRTAEELVDMINKGTEPFGIASTEWINK